VDDNFKHPIDERKVKFKPNAVGTKKDNARWILIITIVSFIISASLQFASSEILEKVDKFTAFLVVLIIILIGVIFDIIGMAVTAADETPFHAMASRKLYGAKQAIKLIKNANKVSSFCNDVVGDICGVISGTASAVIILKISQDMDSFGALVMGRVISGMVAATTIGGKALGKTFAMKNSNYIVYKVSVIIQFVIGRIKLTEKSKKRKSR